MTYRQLSHENKIPIYFMPGMAANPLIFEKLDFERDIYEFYFLEWLEPLPNECLQDYCLRLSKNIHHKNPILIGVSFGGIIVQELAKIIDVRKTVIISSIKDPRELSDKMQLIKKLKLYYLFPSSKINLIERLLYRFSYSKKLKFRLEMYQKYLTVKSKNYLDWCIKQVLFWENKNPVKNIIHIHGSADHIFPSEFIQNAHIIKGASHVLVLSKYKWLNRNLPKLLKD